MVVSPYASHVVSFAMSLPAFFGVCMCCVCMYGCMYKMPLKFMGVMSISHLAAKFVLSHL